MKCPLTSGLQNNITDHLNTYWMSALVVLCLTKVI